MIQAPGAYRPFTRDGAVNEAGLKRGLARQRYVLDRMLAEGFITRQQYDEALAFDLKGSLAKRQERAYTRFRS